MMTSTATMSPIKRIKESLPQEFQRDGEPKRSPLATGLGIFSIGLGLWEAVSPRSVSRTTGIRSRSLLRGYGLREIAAGIGILTSRRPAPYLWARVIGDVLDLATIGKAYATGRRVERRKASSAGVAVLGVAILDVIAAQAHSRR